MTGTTALSKTGAVVAAVSFVAVCFFGYTECTGSRLSKPDPPASRSLPSGPPSPSSSPLPSDPFRVIAHRGASAYAPENTIPAYLKARELGVIDVELDVQLSRDDVVMLFHDSDLLEKTGTKGRVRDYDSVDLLQMDIGRWFDRTHPEVEERFANTKLNTLAALFETFGDQFYYHVELKAEDADLVRLCLEQIQAHGLEERVRFTSFLYEQVALARSIAPGIPADLLVRDPLRLRREARVGRWAPALPLQMDAVDRATAAGFAQVGFAAEELSRELVTYAIERGLQIRAFGIRSDADMRRAIDLGASGMTTNWPDRLMRELLDRRRAPAP